MRRWKLILIVTILSQAFFANFASANSSTNLASDSIFEMPENKIITRWYTAENKEALKGAGGQANFSRKGSPNIYIKPGETTVLADIKGSGTIRRMWFVLFKPYPRGLRGLRLQMFWENETKPAVDVPFGDFMGQSHGALTAFENEFFSSPEGRSFNCFVPMPFKKAAKIQITNESDQPNYIFYEINTTLNEKHSENMLYFHSSWRRVLETKIREDFVILPKVEGKGRFLGCHLQVSQNPATKHFWWGEGEYKVYLDGDTKFPTLCGTGTEDLIGAGYGQGKFDHRYQGNHYLSVEGDPQGSPDGTVFFKDKHGYYRFHVPDPLYFYKDIRVEIQVMGGGSYGDFLRAMDIDPTIKFMKTGKEGIYWTREELEKLDPKGQTTVERSDDHCATAYWYMDKPTNNLPPLAPYADRMEGLTIVP